MTIQHFSAIVGRKLIRKLLGLTSRTAADEILQNLDPTDHHESPNRQLFDTIQVITRARDQKKKISYQYYDYNLQKKLILHNNGEVYTYSPYDFAWNEDRYYLLGCVDKRPGIINPVRMDLLTNVKILDEDAVPGLMTQITASQYCPPIICPLPFPQI